MIFHIFVHKNNIGKLLFVNNITSHVVAILCILAVVQKEYSLIDMSFMYVLLSPMVAISMLFYKKFFKEWSNCTTGLKNETNKNTKAKKVTAIVKSKHVLKNSNKQQVEKTTSVTKKQRIQPSTRIAVKSVK
ncbi:MAG: hypothetical protein JJW01_03810 [Alphaproteobacteria bacterium]|nr:hypothetical protein [Rickettsiales bacterium]